MTYAAQAHHDNHVARVRAAVRDEAESCPYCDDQRLVHPTNFEKHMALYHSDIVATNDFYSQFDIETRLSLQASKKRIDDKMRDAREAMKDIGREFVEAKARLASDGLFLAWVKLEWGWSEKAAQRHMAVYRAFKNDNLTAGLLKKSALYLLAAKSTPQSARTDALELTTNGGKLSVEATKKLIVKHKDVNVVASKYGVRNPETIALLSRIHGTDTFYEVAASGYIQPSDPEKAVHITAPPEDLQAALLDKADDHKAVAMEATAPSGSVMHDNGVYIAAINLGEFTSHAAAEQALEAALKKLSKGC